MAPRTALSKVIYDLLYLLRLHGRLQGTSEKKIIFLINFICSAYTDGLYIAQK